MVKNIEENKLYACSSCGQYKSKEAFSKNKNNKLRDGLNYVCKECYSTIYNNHRINNANDNKLDFTLKARFNDAKQRAKKRGIFNNLVITDIYEIWDKQNGKCAVSGVDMTVDNYSGRISTNVSIDRIDPTQGYIRSNIQLVCSTVNMMKGSLNMDEFLFFCNEILNNNK